MAKQSLLAILSKHFTETPAHSLRSVEFGKYVYQYFTERFDKEAFNAYNEKDFEDPARSLNITRELFNNHEKYKDITDEMMVDFMLDTFSKNRDYFDYAMVADLIESDAYKRFGNGSNRNGRSGSELYNKKLNFEKWLVENSTLSQIDKMTDYDVLINQDSMRRVINGVQYFKFAGDAGKIYLGEIDRKVKIFEDSYIKNADENLYDKLKALAENSTHDDFQTQLKKIYGVIFTKDEIMANYVLPTMIDGITKSADTRIANNLMTTGLGLETNKLLYGISKYYGWSEEMFNNIYIKFPIDKRREQFEQNMAGRTKHPVPMVIKNPTQYHQQGGATVEARQEEERVYTSEELININAKQNTRESEAAELLNAEVSTNEVNSNVTSKPATELYPSKAYPLFDIAKTFTNALVGATIISTISSIPGIGHVAGPAVGVGLLIGSGVYTAKKEITAARQENDGKITTKSALNIAYKTVAAVGLKTAPYLLAAIKGGTAGKALSLWRLGGAAIVGARTFFGDLEKRANLQLAAVEQEEARLNQKPKGIKGFISRIKRLGNAKASDLVKSAAYGFGKGAAMYLGASAGVEIGHTIGSHINIDTDGIKADFHDKLSHLSDDMKNLHGRLVATPEELQHQLGGVNTESVANSVISDASALASVTGNDDLQLSDANLARLSQIGEVELTDHARATSYVENQRQYIGGGQHDWCTPEQQQTAIRTLEKAGVEDPYGVWRKVSSMMRFESAGEIANGGYQATYNHLINGSMNNADVDNIFESLSNINEEGGLGRIPHPTPAPHVTEKTPVNDYVPAPESASVADLGDNNIVVQSDENLDFLEKIEDDYIDTPVTAQNANLENNVAIEESEDVFVEPPVTAQNGNLENNVVIEENEDDFVNTPITAQNGNLGNNVGIEASDDDFIDTPTSARNANFGASYNYEGNLSDIKGGSDNEMADLTLNGSDGKNSYFTTLDGKQIAVTTDNDLNELTSNSGADVVSANDLLTGLKFNPYTFPELNPDGYSKN